MLNNLFPIGLSAAFLLFLTPPAHAKGGFILDLINLGQNAIDGTIPRVYVIGFGVLILAIAILAVREARKNAANPPLETGSDAAPTSSINLEK